MSKHNPVMFSKKHRGITRRDFLKSASMAASAGLLAACGVSDPATSVPEGVITEVPAVVGGARQRVRYLSWWFEEGTRGETWVNFIKEFNESQNEIEVVAENTPFDQYTTKTIVGAQSGELDGDIVMATPGTGATPDPGRPPGPAG